MPPAFTWGHEAFTSMPFTSGTSARRLQTSAYSWGAVPKTLAITVTPPGKAGSFSAMKASTPTFSRLMALSMPAGASAIRGGGFPMRGSGVRLLATKPPMRVRSRKGDSSVP